MQAYQRRPADRCGWCCRTYFPTNRCSCLCLRAPPIPLWAPTSSLAPACKERRLFLRIHSLLFATWIPVRRTETTPLNALWHAVIYVKEVDELLKPRKNSKGKDLNTRPPGKAVFTWLEINSTDTANDKTWRTDRKNPRQKGNMFNSRTLVVDLDAVCLTSDNWHVPKPDYATQETNDFYRHRKHNIYYFRCYSTWIYCIQVRSFSTCSEDNLPVFFFRSPTTALRDSTKRIE